MEWLIRSDARAIPLPDNSVEACVTDVPYGLEFMGKQWDAPWRSDVRQGWRGETQEGAGPFHHGVRSGIGRSYGGDPLTAMRAYQAWCEQWAREVLRVLKPGGWLLCFGGTRTVHRLTSGIEDAGFEILDETECWLGPRLSWVYGQGMPKVGDVGKMIDKRRQDNPDWQRVGAWLREQRQAAGLSAKAVCEAIGAHGEINHGGAVSNWENGFSCPTWDQWLQLKTLLAFGDGLDAEVWRLNGRKGKPGEAWEQREILGARPGIVGSGFGNVGHGLPSAPDAVLDTAPATPEAVRWTGWSPALKPAHEPIVVARKPLIGTLVANVLQWGTGALNIDATRVSGPGPGPRPGGDRAARQAGVMGKSVGRGPSEDHPAGRWPANVVLVHGEGCQPVGTRKVRGAHYTGDAPADYSRDGELYGDLGSRTPTTHVAPDGTETVEAWECMPGCPVAELDAMSGERRSAGHYPTTYSNSSGYGGGIGRVQGPLYDDQGGASRFFYTAKASSSDRRSHRGADNRHPTVKPVELMRWLVKLVTPPRGLVLDPFCGSASTGVACIREGFDFLGLDLWTLPDGSPDLEAMETACRRLHDEEPTLFGAMDPGV
jgi:transcriptional regulator with XRE-family HTH domain